MTHLETDVLIVGAGAAGMYAAVSAARSGAAVLLLDKSLIGRGGATVMAQMTVAAAIGHAEPDDWQRHLDDTIAAGRGLCDPALAEILCREGPARILEMDDWKVGWTRDGDRIRQVMAPGHSASRCVYVDFLNTGPAVSRTLRGQLNRTDGIRRVGDLCVTDIVTRDGAAVGAVALHNTTGETATIAAKAVIIATGGLTRLYRRNSASANMGGDGFALALRAGAELIDMEFPQFFPIGHLAPRLIGMDPIMWDPFRYKLGGRLLNADGAEFLDAYGIAEDGKYVATRDLATYAIVKEAEAGRGSPHGGAYLSFEHVAEADLRAAFGPVIDRLAANGIDLTKMPVEVAPIAHYHMGGIRVDTDMQTTVANLFAAGEAIGGPNGANRLSGNAITEALVFGERAGRAAARAACGRSQAWTDAAAAPMRDVLQASGPANDTGNATADIADLQALMADNVGPFRDEDRLTAALAQIRTLRATLPGRKPPRAGGYDAAFMDWLELRNMALTAEAVTLPALHRRESRGAHQREDFPDSDPAWQVNQILSMHDGQLNLWRQPVAEPEKATA